MPLHIREYVDIKSLSSFKMGSKVRWFAEVHSKADIEEAVIAAEKLDTPLCILGSGFNTIFSDDQGCLPYFLIHIKNKGIEKVHEDSDSVIFNVKSGEDWDSFVQHAVLQNLSGIETLSHIPSSVGATPIQNVGAYGQEVCQTITSVYAYDTYIKSWVVLSNSECKFEYRKSIFKSKEKGRHIIESVDFRLSRRNSDIPKHLELKRYMEEHNLSYTTKHLRDAVIALRTKKLPDPSLYPNCGSFFENTIVAREKADELISTYPDIPHYPEKDENIKISTAWMIDQCGLKGISFGHISICAHNALILIHDGHGTYTHLKEAEEYIIQKVRGKFNVTIVREPNVIC